MITSGNNFVKIILLITLLVRSGNDLHGQLSSSSTTGADQNSIQTAVPFLTIAPDARAGAMGDAGVASEADVNSQHWNAAKYAFIKGKGGFAISYTPWLRNLVKGINLSYLSGYYKINDKNTVSSSFRYFSLGTVAFPNLIGAVAGEYNPYELALDAGYSRLFTDHFSTGIVLRYIRSDLTRGQTTAGGRETRAGTSLAGDLGLYYQNDFQVGSRDAEWAIGLNVSNVGTPISYTEDAKKTPIPTNLRIGGRFKYIINNNHSIALITDLNKLMVPTPPVYDHDTATGNWIIIEGKEPPESVLGGMFQSFGDAPGIERPDGSRSVFLEEMYEIAYAVGVEYNYGNFLAIRSGYFHEHTSEGNRKFITAGLCIMNPIFSLDLSYLAPTTGLESPLANTFRFTLTTQFGWIPDTVKEDPNSM